MADVHVALWVRLDAKPGKEKEVADFLRSGLAIVQEEPATTAWFAIQMGPSTLRHLRCLSQRCGTASSSLRDEWLRR